MGNKKPNKRTIKNTIDLLGENEEYVYLKITKCCPHCRESLDLKNVCVSKKCL